MERLKDMGELLISVLSQVLELQNILLMLFGVLIGIIAGALPGITATLAVALMLPFTFELSPEGGILFLIGIYCAGIYGGSISAVLIGTPGTPASAATVADGYALTKQGRAYEALNMSLYASVIAGLISGVILLLVAPQLAKFALRFGPPEYFSLAVFGLTVISGVSGDSMIKGLKMVTFGLLLSTIGMDAFEGQPRFLFNMNFLYSGIGLIPTLTGLFAISEVLIQIEIRAKSISSDSKGLSDKNRKYNLKNLKPYMITILRSSIIGSIIGAIPGTGGAIASFVCYNQAKQTSKNPDKFGKGSLEGIAASEAGNNGTTGATLIPMLTLGIPGDTVTAVLLGALTIHGLVPGPMLFIKHPELVYTIMVGFLIVNLFLFFEAKIGIRWFSKVTLIPSSILLSIILLLTLVGSYANSNSMDSVGIALFFGVLGYVFKKSNYPIPPMFIAMILGPLIEVSLRQSLILSNGSILIFFMRPISLFFIVLIAISIFVSKRKRRILPQSNVGKGV